MMYSKIVETLKRKILQTLVDFEVSDFLKLYAVEILKFQRFATFNVTIFHASKPAGEIIPTPVNGRILEKSLKK